MWSDCVVLLGVPMIVVQLPQCSVLLNQAAHIEAVPLYWYNLESGYMGLIYAARTHAFIHWTNLKGEQVHACTHAMLP